MGHEAAQSKRWIVRDFRPTDLASVVQVSRTSVEASQWTPESYSTLAASPGGLLLVADSGSSVTGFLAARTAGGEAEILNLAVSWDIRRAGIGAALVTAALERFAQRRFDSVHLEVRASNAAAIALYGKLGFSIASRRNGYYRDPVEDAVCMMTKLTGVPS